LSIPIIITALKHLQIKKKNWFLERGDSKSKVGSRPVPRLEPLYNKTSSLQNGHNDLSKFPSRAFKEEVEIVKEIPILASTDRARKRKGQLSNEKIKLNLKPWQGEGNKILPGAEEYDPFQVIEWNPRGMGKLPGSEIKVREIILININGELILFNSLYI
jgi:hypothetical protein